MSATLQAKEQAIRDLQEMASMLIEDVKRMPTATLEDRVAMIGYIVEAHATVAARMALA